MSGLPPTLNAETGTPANEWAQATTTAALGRDDPAPAADSSVPPGVRDSSSAVSTPGHRFPGAYPSETVGLVDTEAITQVARNAIDTVTTTAQQYLPVIQDTAGQYVSAARESMSSYLPGGAANAGAGSTVRASLADIPHKTSLPTTETHGALPHEHVAGAGSLPGSIGEEKVARLPDERSFKGDTALYPSYPIPPTAPANVLSPASPSAGGTSTVPALAGAAVPATAAFTALEPSGTHPPHPQDTAVTLRDSLPSQELTGQAPYTHQDGVGALPGLKRESGVARLPDEGGVAGATAATISATGTQSRDWGANPTVPRPGDEQGNENLGTGERRVGRDVAGGVGSLVGGKGEEGVALLPDERRATDAKTSAQESKGGKLAEMDQSEREEQKRSAAAPKPEQRSAGNEDRAYEAGDGRQSRQGDERKQDKEGQMNLLHANLQPRAYPLGTPDATWRGIGVGVGSGYTDGEGVDIGCRPDIDETPAIEADGYDTAYHPAELHPPSADMEQAPKDGGGGATKGDATKVDDEEGVSGQGQGGEKMRTRKASFMDKMKGEAKVIIGKLEGKKGVEKVNEGTKMKAGEV